MRSHADREIPMTARTIPIRMPMTVDATARISVFARPTVSRVGNTAHIASQSKKIRKRSIGDQGVGRYCCGMGEPGNHFW